MQFKLIFYTILFISFLLPRSPAYAAEFYFGSHAKDVGVNQTVEVGVFLNSEGEAVNAAEGEIVIRSGVEMVEIRDGNSFIPFWIEKPHPVYDTTGTLSIGFSGMIPGGYSGGDAYLFSILFRPTREAPIEVSVRDRRVLLNDGQGTAARTRFSPLTLRAVSGGVGEAMTPDHESPEAFTPVLSQDASVFDGKWFVAFSAQDKRSGISHYDIFETREKYSEEGIRDAKGIPWTHAESPQALSDQELHSFVWIRAVDRAGNDRIALLLPQAPLRWYENRVAWGILGGICIVFVLLLRRVWRKKYS